MRLILVRHARPTEMNVIDGRADPSLSDIGREQAARLAAPLTSLELDALYSSPLNRTKETAAPTAAKTGLDVTIDERLVELDSRLSVYTPDDQLDPKGEMAEAFFKGDWSKISTETPDQFFDRIRSSLDEIVQRHRGQTVAVFTHGGVINAWLACAVGAERFPITWFLSDYGAMNRFVTTGHDSTLILALNEHPPRGPGGPDATA